MNDRLSKDGEAGWSAPGYHPVRELGTGGTGRVVQAVHDGTGLPVAIKYLSAGVRDDEQLLDRFRGEARTLESLNTPHVVALYEYLETHEGVALVMELVEGAELRAILRTHAPLPAEAAFAVLKGSLLGLAAAHERGLVHRDYKPGNVLVTEDGISRLVDFGIAARQGDTANAAGTPAYMPPEQWQGLPPSPQADVYAATATFFECLTGTPPFLSTKVSELAVQHIEAPVPVDRVREELRGLVLRGLAKDSTERPASAQEFIAELEPVARSVCGGDWEERGRRALAALVALLALFPEPGTGGSGGSDSSATLLTGPEGISAVTAGARRRTMPGKRMQISLAAGSAVLALGAVASMAAQGNDGGSHRPQAAEQVVGPVDTPPAESPPASGSASGRPAKGTGSPTVGVATTSGATEEAVAVQDDPGAAETSSATIAGAPAETGTGPSADPQGGSEDPAPESEKPTTDSVPEARVGFLGVTGFTAGANNRATATISVTTDSSEPVRLTVNWYDAYQGSTARAPGDQDGGSQTFVLQGRTRYTIAVEHFFDALNCTSFRGVLATTSPGAQAARPYRSGWTQACLPR
jgi:serine/threonine-protein kinase